MLQDVYIIYLKIYILYTQTRIFLIQESVQKRACRESQIPNILYNRFSIVLAFLWFFAGWFWPSTNHMSPLQNLISIRSYSLRKCYLSFSTAPKVKYGWFIFFTGQFVYLQNHNWSRYVNDMVMAMSHSLEHLQIEATSLRQGTYHGILHGASARGQLQRFGWVEGWGNLFEMSLRTSPCMSLWKWPRCNPFEVSIYTNKHVMLYICSVIYKFVCGFQTCGESIFSSKQMTDTKRKTRPVGETHGTRDVSGFVSNAEWPMPPGSAGPHLLTLLQLHRTW